MTQPSLEEQLSALIDGELEEEEMEAVVSALFENPELLAKLTRYHQAGQLIREIYSNRPELQNEHTESMRASTQKLLAKYASMKDKIGKHHSKKTDKV